MFNLHFDIVIIEEAFVIIEVIIIEEAFGNAFIDHFNVSCKPNFHEN